MQTKHKSYKGLIYILLVLLSLFMLVPFYWMVISSLKLNKDVFSIPMKWWPDTMHWDNYQIIWKKLPFSAIRSAAVRTLLANRVSARARKSSGCSAAMRLMSLSWYAMRRHLRDELSPASLLRRARWKGTSWALLAQTWSSRSR